MPNVISPALLLIVKVAKEALSAPDMTKAPGTVAAEAEARARSLTTAPSPSQQAK